MTRPLFPNGARFAFTMFDDADESTVANSAPAYRVLARHGILTTKSVWVYPPRGHFHGESLEEPHHRAWIGELRSQGFEIALHNVGDGSFTRAEILEGLERFREVVGAYPRSFSNHASNPDNMYWWHNRFEWPFSWLYRVAYRMHSGGRKRPSGHDQRSPHFWGDAFKKHVDYARNLTFNGIDTLAHDPRMPYRIRSKSRYSNCWFSSSDGQTVGELNELISEKNVDALEARGGVCIVYTHMANGFVDAAGNVDRTFEERMAYLASKRGWFVPVSTLLDHLAAQGTDADPGYPQRLALNVRWVVDRMQKQVRYRRQRG